MTQSTEQWIQAEQQRWATQDTTAAVKKLHTVPAPSIPEVTLNPSIIYINDRELWNLDAPPPKTDWVPTLLASLLLVVILFLVWKVHTK